MQTEGDRDKEELLMRLNAKDKKELLDDISFFIKETTKNLQETIDIHISELIDQEVSPSSTENTDGVSITDIFDEVGGSVELTVKKTLVQAVNKRKLYPPTGFVSQEKYKKVLNKFKKKRARK